MKFKYHSKIFWGKNIYANIPTIIYHFENDQDPSNAIKTFKKLKSVYRNIFMRIKKNQDQIIISTYFPEYFDENSKLIKNLVKDGFRKNKESIKESIKDFFGSPSNIAILNYAIKIKLPIQTFKIGNHRYHQVGYGKNSAIFRGPSTIKDSKISKTIQCHKDQTNEVAEMLGIKTPKWYVVDKISELKKAFLKLQGSDIVIKPYNLTRGIGVFVGIKNLEDAISKFKIIKKLYKEKNYSRKNSRIIVQEKAEGNDYRILCINNKFAIATQRTPAYIIGDGKNSIKKLIQIENRNPLRNKHNLFFILKPIIIDLALKETLADQSLSLDSIPTKGQIVKLKKVASVSQGGITTDATDNVHPQIKLLCESISSFIGSYILGIDMIIKDISKPIENNVNLIEVNTSPEMFLNIYPYKGKKYDDIIGKLVLDGLIDTSRKVPVYINSNIPNIPNDTKDKITYIYNTKSGILEIKSQNVKCELKTTLKHIAYNNHFDQLIIVTSNTNNVLINDIPFYNID